MYGQKRSNDAVHWYMSELSSRVVAKSGQPSDRYHLGKLILQGLKDAPDFILQIDGSTGESESFSSAIKRTVTCANAFRSMGLKHGDVIVLMAPNHLDLIIPYYAALCLGVIVAPVDRLLHTMELEHIFSIDEPKIVFCQSEKASDVRQAIDELKLPTTIVTFDKQNATAKTVHFDEIMKKYEGITTVEDFQAADFDPEESIAMLVATSGTTGLPKQAAVTHKNFLIANPQIFVRERTFPTPTKMFIVMSPMQWLSAVINLNMAPILRYTLLMSPKTMTPDHVHHLINTYKPTFILTSPTMFTSLIKPGVREKCDFTSVELMYIGGSAVSAELLEEIKALTPKTDIRNMYGMSEISGNAFISNFDTPLKSSGKPASHLQYRLIDVETRKDIMEPNMPGELWLQGPSVFKGYYNNEQATKDTFSEDGWLKTGDLFCRDEQWNFYFLERIKLLLKYKNHQISPVEIQNVIRQHPGVMDVAVTGIPDKECGDLPVAGVVRRPGHNVTAQEIKDLVKASLTDTKQLRGGVVFLDSIPVTASTKVNYRALQKIALETHRE